MITIAHLLFGSFVLAMVLGCALAAVCEFMGRE